MDKAQRGWEEEEGGNIGGQGRGRADTPPSRFGEGGQLPPPIAADHRGPMAGLLREVTPWSIDGGDRQIKVLVGDRCIGKENRPPPSSGGKLKLQSLIGVDVTVDDNNNE